MNFWFFFLRGKPKKSQSAFTTKSVIELAVTRAYVCTLDFLCRVHGKKEKKHMTSATDKKRSKEMPTSDQKGLDTVYSTVRY
jgi:hypothetical protein